MIRDLTPFVIRPDAEMREAMKAIDRNAKGICLVLEADQRLVGTITDGDIRRAILAGLPLDTGVQTLLERRTGSRYAKPLSAPLGTSEVRLLSLMNEQSVRHIPLVDNDGRVVALASQTDLVKDYELPLRAVVMAGGFGKRLRPLTDATPKPMLPVGDQPLLERIVGSLRKSGIRRVKLTTHYHAEVITRHFGDGQAFGVDIDYVNEETPMGTAGALSLVGDSDEPILVMNGDILTRVDFAAMLDFHRDHGADMSVAVRAYEFRVPYGVVDTDGVLITRIVEKPLFQRFVSAGIYLLNPELLRLIPGGQVYDMPELIQRLMSEGRRVVGFPVREYWLDIGRMEDYEQAVADMASGNG